MSFAVSFKVLEGVNTQEDGLGMIRNILNLIEISDQSYPNNKTNSLQYFNTHQNKLLNLFLGKVNQKDYPISLYTPKRLKIALDKYEKNRSKKDLLLEVISRFYYDSCNQGKYLILDYPPLLQIEIASRCNYKCVFCYQSDESFTEKDSKYMGFMDIDLFKMLIDQIEGNIPYITFASRGEPTLNPNFIEMLEYCKGKFLDIKLNTNASTLNKQKINSIIDVCDTVVFSIDTPNPDHYPNIRVGGNLENVLKNIRLFNKLRSEHPRGRKINTRASGVLFNESIQSEKDYKRTFAPLFDQTAFVKYNPWEKIYTLPKNDIKAACHQPFYRFFIWFDGSYNCCDMDYKSLLSEGCNMISKDYTVKDAWSSKRMQKIRNLHQSGERGRLTPCKQCPISS